MPDATELCSTTNIKLMLGITTSGQDSLLALVKAAVEQYVKTYTGRDLLVASYTEYYDGDGTGNLRLNQRPIVSVTSIHADPARNFASASLIPASDLIGDARSFVVGWLELFSYTFLKGKKAIKVVYSAGYATVPVDLAQATMLIICKQYKVAFKQLYAEGSQQVGDVQITLSPDAFPKDAMDILNRYLRLDF